MSDNGHDVSPVQVAKTEEGSYYEAFVTVDGAKFPIGVIKSGELEARIQEAADAAAEAKAAGRSSK